MKFETYYNEVNQRSPDRIVWSRDFLWGLASSTINQGDKVKSFRNMTEMMEPSIFVVLCLHLYIYIYILGLHLHISMHIYVYLCICLGYSSACGDQLIRFSYATNMSRPQESGYMQATYKKAEARKKHTIRFHNSQQTTRACGSMVTGYIHIINYFDTTVYIQQ